MVTMKEVAALAGVSAATVSCALSGKKRVSHRARIRIMAVIEKAGYVVNENARKLKLKTSREIGVLLTSIDDIYHSELFKGISQAVQENGFSINIAFSNNQPKVESETLNEFVSRGCAGIILISCMSGDTPYFERFLARGIPAVFVERRPPGLDVHFAGLSNKKTTAFLAEELRRKGYRNLALFCGNPAISSEDDCAGAFREFNRKTGRPAEYGIHYTAMSREDAFRIALNVLRDVNGPLPDAIIATSDNIARGILESGKVLGGAVNRILCAVFGEETWMDTPPLSRAPRTSRPAFTLGTKAAGLLLECIAEKESAPEGGEAGPGRAKSVILDDNILRTGLRIPKRRPRQFKNSAARKQEFNLLIPDSDWASAAGILFEKFRKEYGIAINIEKKSQRDLPGEITGDLFSINPRYDVFVFDIPWLPYLVQNGCLEELTDFVLYDRVFSSIIKENLVNSMYQNRYYSVPFSGGAQLLFYRNDLFEDPLICRNYFAMTGSRLQPPRTWAEFNDVARFFTRRFNPASPVEFGTSCPGQTPEELCPEIYNRIWGHNGSLFNSRGLPQCDSPCNIRAFESFIETLRYIPRPVFETSLTGTVSDFYRGKTAMLITYTVYASRIMDAINHEVFGKLGFSFVPHRTPVSIGWNLGINPFSPKKNSAKTFFKWLYRKDVNYYLTILNGQSTSVHPYENNELLNLYPWMKITRENFKYARRRTAGQRKNTIIIPWNRIEDIIYAGARRIFTGAPAAQCLNDMNARLTGLMTTYGHFF